MALMACDTRHTRELIWKLLMNEMRRPKMQAGTRAASRQMDDEFAIPGTLHKHKPLMDMNKS